MTTQSERNAQIDRLISALDGNGHEGLKARTARIEEHLETMAEKDAETAALIKEIALQQKQFTKALDALGVIVQKHLDTKHMKDFINKKGYWALFISAIVILNLLARYIPDFINLILAAFGSPLRIPLQ